MLRWRIGILLSVAIAISYLDRQTLPVAIKAISVDIPISNQFKAFLDSAFLFAYALMYLGGGKLMDIIGTRRGFALTMLVWSLACASHGLAAEYRDALDQPAAAGPRGRRRVSCRHAGDRRVVSRARAVDRDGVDQRGQRVGRHHRPAADLAGDCAHGLVSFNGVAVGFLYHRRRGSALDDLVVAGLCAAACASWIEAGGAETHCLRFRIERCATDRIPYRVLLSFRETWGLLGAKFFSDAAWFFYLFWLPKYLYDAHGFDIKAVGSIAWIPHAAAGVGCMCGGGLSSYLLFRGCSVNFARKVAMAASIVLMPLLILVPHVPVTFAIVLFCVGYFGHQSWSTLVMVTPTDLFPRRAIGTIAGMIGFAGAMGGVVFGQLAGYLLDHGADTRRCSRYSDRFM